MGLLNLGLDTLIGPGSGGTPAPTIEDLTTYTEVDEDGDFTVTAPKIAFSSMRRDATSRLFYDFGAAYFGDFDIDFEFKIDSAGGDKSLCAVFALANSIGDTTALYNGGSGVGFSVSLYTNSNNMRVRLLGHNGNTDDYIDGGTSTALMYASVSRSGSTVTLVLYSDASRTIVVDTLVITLNATTFRYLYALNSWGDSSGEDADTLTGYTQNFKIISAS